jgi:nucleoside-diphosphate-sugar epimerase
LNILVTGGCGYIGSNLCNFLKNKEHNVTALDCDVKQEFTLSQSIKIIEKDILKIEPNDLIGFNHVFHLAALPRIGMSFKNPKDFFLVNTQGTISILDACRKNNCSLSFISSSSCDSSSYLNPYSCSKYLAESACRMYQETFDLPITTARLFNVYGNNHLRHGEKACFIGLIEKSFIDHDEVIIYGSGNQRRDFTHVDDICEGLYSTIKLNIKEIIDLGFGRNYSINEIAHMFKIKKIKNLPARKGEGNCTLANIATTKKYIDWEPKIEIKDYIDSFIQKFSYQS